MNEQTPADPHESLSLSEHEAAFGGGTESPAAAEAEPVAVPEPQQPAGEPEPAPANTDEARGERDELGRWKPREKHRAKSQHATAADVPRINELTKKHREAEARAIAAEKRAQELEQRLTAPKVPEPPKDFTDKEPRYEDFAGEEDQYLAHTRALAAYDRKKEAFDAQKAERDTAAKTAAEERNKQRDAWFKEKYTAHGERMNTFFQKNPQAEGIIEQANVQLNPVMLAALLASDNSDEVALKLAQDPDLVDDLHVLTDDKAPSQDLVAYVQRRISRGLKVAATGSTAPAPVVPALPRPPNPVRTGVMKPADTPPGDDAPLSEHERAYGSGGRRRR